MKGAKQLLRRLAGRGGSAMGLLLGADGCRYVLPGGDQPVFCEPSILWRRRDDKRIILAERSIGDVAEGTFICRHAERYERVCPFGRQMLADEYLLTCLLRYFRRRFADRCNCRAPARLAVTGRPRLLPALQGVLGRAARAAGLRECAMAEEHVCLAADVKGEPTRPLLIADVGHLGARVYAWQGGRFVREAFRETEVGGEEMLEAITRLLHTGPGLLIGPTAARRLLAEMGRADAWPCEVGGRNLATGRPRRQAVACADVEAVVRPLYADIADLCRDALAALPAGSAAQARVVLAGAAAGWSGFAPLLARKLAAPAELAPQPGDASARGLGRLLSADPALEAPPFLRPGDAPLPPA